MLFYGLTDWQFYAFGLYFLAVVMILWWFPGWLVLKKEIKLSKMTKAALAVVLGMVFLTIVAYGSGILGCYNLVYVYEGGLILMAIWEGWQWRCRQQKEKRKLLKKNEKLIKWRRIWKEQRALLILVVLALMIQLPAIFGSGLRTDDGVRFFFTNNQDGLMHLGFVNSLAQSWPAMRPEVNAPLENYHYFSDLLWAQLVRLGLPTVNVFFQFVPCLLVILITVVIYQAILVVTKKKTAAFWVTLVCLIAGDGGYFLSWFIPGGKGWEMATFDNGADQFLNMPFMAAKLIFFSSWLLLNYYWQERKSKILWWLLILLAPLILFKVYWWAFFLGGWGASLVFRTGRALMKKSKTKEESIIKMIKREFLKEGIMMLLAAGTGLILLKSITSVSDGLIYAPLVWPREIAAEMQLNWREWFLREQQFIANNNGKRIIWENFKLVGVALIFVYGARLFGLLIGKKAARWLKGENICFFSASFIVWTIIGFNFLQAKGGFNTFNFLILGATALSVLLGVNLASWWEKSEGKRGSAQFQKVWIGLKRILVIAIVILLIPRTSRNMWHYWQATITRNEEAGFYERKLLELLNKAQELTITDNLIGVAPTNERMKRASVIPGLIGRKTYLSNQMILETHNFDFKKKESSMKKIFQETDAANFGKSLNSLGIEILILEQNDMKKMSKELLDGLKSNLMVVFENDAGWLIKV